ncbi:MAG TPA: tetratricopeptide repeat protein, partial [Spirochaetota bacterium]|nr:tetratricopeptide repeat protein [Spirochaetota bacterium]HQH31353.1 tetratricopeptide repeat protein [Spirochaetota bacterium]
KDDDPDYYNYLGNCYYNLGRYKDAIPCYKKAIELKDDNPVYHNNLGNCYKSLGRYEEAMKTYNKALELDPGNVKIISNIDSIKDKASKKFFFF